MRAMEEIVTEPLVIHADAERPAAEELHRAATEIMRAVGLDESALRRYPHEFSGGQRQRIGIARALILRPRFVVCDEPVSALDVSVGAQIVNLLKKLQRDFGLTYLFISHSMPVVRYLCDRIAVMRRGEIVEIGGSEQITSHPQHEYTQTLRFNTTRLSRNSNWDKKEADFKNLTHYASEVNRCEARLEQLDHPTDTTRKRHRHATRKGVPIGRSRRPLHPGS